MQPSTNPLFTRFHWSFLAALALTAAACDKPSAPVPTQSSLVSQAILPAGFVEIPAFQGLNRPTAVRFAADGRVFVAEKSGRILVFDDMADTTPTLFANLQTNVYDYADRGLLGLALDPNFPAVPHVYVLYTYDAEVGGVAPKWNDACPNPPGDTQDGCVASARLSRLTADGNTMTGAEQVLLESWGQQYPSHSIGTLAFGADGALYLSAGDAASFTFVDYGQKGIPQNPLGDPPVAVGAAQTPPTAEGGALRSQSLNRVAGPAVLHGAILRLDPSNGAGKSDNPLAGNADTNARRIVGYGLRNPFRMTVRPGTNELWIGDVGWNRWEEINRIVDPLSPAVANFGWPCYEGGDEQGDYVGAGLSLCARVKAAGGARAPHYTYLHSAEIVPGDDCKEGSSSVSGLAFYTGDSYPAQYKNALFFADYARGCAWAMLPDASGLPDPTKIVNFVQKASSPVDLEIGPGGDLFYVDINGGAVWRVQYLVPTSVVTAESTNGTPGSLLTFHSESSKGALPGDTLTYAWDLDGDGAFDDATDKDSSFIYTAVGTYNVRLKVTDQRGASAVSVPVAITITELPQNNSAPVPVIDTPLSTLTWAAGDTIAFSGHATDPEDGALPASALTWQIVLQHCPDGCHAHVIETREGVASGTFPASDHDYPSHLELRLIATDSQGIKTTTSVRLDPKTVVLSFASEPPGLDIAIHGLILQTPFNRIVIRGSQNSVAAVSPQTHNGNVYLFDNWAHGGAAGQELPRADSNASYTARFHVAGLKGEYFDERDFTSLKLTRQDGPIDFDWGDGSPAPSVIGSDTFSVRWTGQVMPKHSETITFYTVSDDGIRLWVDNQLIIDNWTLHGETTNTGTIALTGGRKYDIKMEFWEEGGGAIAKLQWSSPSLAREAIPAANLFPPAPPPPPPAPDAGAPDVAPDVALPPPTPDVAPPAPDVAPDVAPPPPPVGTGLRGEYYADMTGTKSVLVRTDPAVNFTWGTGSPGTGVPVDKFFVRWTGHIEIPRSETVTFIVNSDDGCRLWVDNKRVIEDWTDHAPRDSKGSITLTGGTKVDIRLEYYENGGGAQALLYWESPGQTRQIIPTARLFPATGSLPPPPTTPGTGLKGEYWDQLAFGGPVVVTRTDATVDFDWARGVPAPGIAADTFTVRWTGQLVAPFSETFTFTTTSDDGVRLFVDGVKVIDNWTDHARSTNTGRIALLAGQKVDIKMEFYDNGYDATARLLWASTSQPQQVVPTTALYPAP